MAQNISGRGVMVVRSKIVAPDILDEKTFFKWYEEDHIAEILETSGIKSAWRFVNNDPNADKPYLAIYPMEDIAFTQGQEFKNIRVRSELLPGNAVVYDLADFDVRYDNLTQIYDPTKKGKGHTKTLITAEIQLNDDHPEEDFDRWYREEHLGRLATVEGYLRTTRYKLAYARGNAQSRALKGIGSTPAEPAPQPPTFLAMHEFSTETVDLDKLREVTASDWTKRIHAGSKNRVYSYFRLAKNFGQQDMFYES